MSVEATQTVGELAASIPGATREFERLGIDYCCGGNRTLGEACVDAKIPVEQALAQLQNVSPTSDARVDRDWSHQPLVDLIAHISETHHAFVREECPRIERLAGKVVSVHGTNHPELLQVKETFSALAGELMLHLTKEEQILFPYIALMEQADTAGEPAPSAMFGTVMNPVRMMMQEHDGAGDALKKLRSITSDYETPYDACISYVTLYDALRAFEADLHQHIHLENNILFPRSVALETKRQ